MGNAAVSLANAINPESGERDLMGALRCAVTKLNQQEDIQRGTIYHVLPGRFRDRLDQIGIPVAYVADFCLLMQELGVARHCGANSAKIWEVCDTTYFDVFASKQWLLAAMTKLRQRQELTNTNFNLRKKLEGIEKSNSTAGGDSKKSVEKVDLSDPPLIQTERLEEMAEMVAEVEHLNGLVAEKDARIGSLEQELASRPKDEPDAVAAALIERFRKAKTP